MFTSLALAAPFAHPAIGIGFGIFFILIVALIIGLATRRRRWARWGAMNGGWGGPWGHGHGYWGGQQAARAAETTLAERFAQGDIDEKEYRARLEVLRANAPQPPMGPTAPQK